MSPAAIKTLARPTAIKELENLAPFRRFPYAQRASRDVDHWQY
jgi:hypothetical protein